tara:strand:+ start:116 stop:415 length:300 start_codon:yes stop_codon:yes gene_type:complete
MEVNISERFLDEYMSDGDGEREMQRLLSTYEKSNDYDKSVIDNVFIHLCGWSLHTLANAELLDMKMFRYPTSIIGLSRHDDAEKRLSNYYKERNKEVKQ